VGRRRACLRARPSFGDRVADSIQCRHPCTRWPRQRNFQARNILNEMRPGDILLYYHSSCKVPGIAGIATVRPLLHGQPRHGGILIISLVVLYL